MEKKNFLNPQELFNNLREMRRQAKENLIALMKENNLDYVHTDIDVLSEVNCNHCYCHVYNSKIGCMLMVSVQGVRLTADDKLKFDWSAEVCGTAEESDCSHLDMMGIYSTVYSILVREDGDDFDYKRWLEENADLYK